ncbi:binding-protein-dependent transport systems inner membrane component [Paenibacillus vortex V453]|jgi:raffinose/stachyose/melibiose transport system permease protein|uniref:ABC transporter permease n=2 Tax=Paenibacillus TaxID=44249 RepID=A0A163JU06_9BACL|nr:MULTISPECIES: sugar ABC transporter permease [Paenibacillus]ANA80784.1 ABC transporter permease [Paenibacillus glucanolyticus]AVV55144.1 sugar ABC transporter permease [Paenibacillus glucanolyticus]AWP29733.1 ABC transporter permease [Paenibacillus sp. Cedars]EFU42741.1 binding-protein-dependent transport systems inner membrane component [Paenibacillus vortex V453]ETT31071.1 binding-protein-dependent transport systems inner membrane component [Paenibacillus sp. FSL R5-808]
MNRKKSSALLQQFLFVGPSTIFFILIMIIPFLLGLYYSFTNWNGVSSKIDWVGFDNFVTIFTNDDKFRDAFWFTTRFTVLGVILTNLLGFLLAYFLTKPLKTRNVLRTIFFMPNVIGGLLLGFIWQFIFVKGFAAIGNATNLGFFNLPWLGTKGTAFWAIVIVFVWQTAGYLMVIYISSLNNVPKDILEAAEIDGASRGQVLRSIIIPLVMPAVTVCLFLAISWSFKMFDLNLSLTKGGPFGSTESVAMNIYNEAYTNNRLGLGTAKAVIFFIVVAIITSLQVRFTKSKEVEA